MIVLLSFLSSAALLTLEGFLLFSLLSNTKKAGLLGISLGYPLGVFLNTLLFFALFLSGLPLSEIVIGSAHLILVIVLIALYRFRSRNMQLGFFSDQSSIEQFRMSPLMLCCILFLILVAASSIIYAAFLPTFYWDSFTSWAMRAQQSFTAKTILMEGVRQPQYPILMHSHQMLFMYLVKGWSDLLSGASMLLLSVSSFTALFLLITRSVSRRCAIMTLTLLTGIPLVIIHLRQGFADIHLSQFALISAILLHMSIRRSNQRLLLISALFCAAAAWTKLEGLYYCVVPWLVIVSLYSWNQREWTPMKFGVLPLLIFAIPWYLFIFLLDLNLSPHGLNLSFHTEAISEVIRQLFTIGTFGLHWWIITILTPTILWMNRKSTTSFTVRNPALLWGFLSLILILATYLLTDDVKGLMNADNFSRVMILPTLLFTLGLSVHCCTSTDE